MLEARLQIGMREACLVLDVSSASIYRDLEPIAAIPVVKLAVPSPRALKPEERSAILFALNSDEFADKSPAQAFHSLLDRGEYLGSVRTFYRVLASVMAVIERRAIARHPYRPVPQLLATAPNRVWSWDITKLKAAGHCLCLYVILDIFSRYVVGWTLASTESSGIAVRLIPVGWRHPIGQEVDDMGDGDAEPADARAPGQNVGVLGDAIERVRHDFLTGTLPQASRRCLPRANSSAAKGSYTYSYAHSSVALISELGD